MASSTGGPAIDWQFGSPRAQWALVTDIPGLQLSASRGIADTEVSAASTADRATLQECRPFSRRRGSRQFVSATVGFKDVREILLKLLPADVAGMGVRECRRATPRSRAFAETSPCRQGPPVLSPTVDIGAGISRIVKGPDRGRCRQRPEDLVSPTRKREGNEGPHDETP